MSTKMSTTEALKPCPFCGKLAALVFREESVAARCIDWGAGTCLGASRWADDEGQARAAWNERAALAQQAVPQTDEVVERGWKLVPIQPTPAMLAAPYDNQCPNEAAEVYQSMLAAAPTPKARGESPPLPEPIYREGDAPSMGEVRADCYTAAQMQAYARIALSQAVPQTRGLSDDEIDAVFMHYAGQNSFGAARCLRACYALEFRGIARALLARAGAVEGGR